MQSPDENDVQAYERTMKAWWCVPAHMRTYKPTSTPLHTEKLNITSCNSLKITPSKFIQRQPFLLWTHFKHDKHILRVETPLPQIHTQTVNTTLGKNIFILKNNKQTTLVLTRVKRTHTERAHEPA